MKLRRAPYLKINTSRRQFVKLRRIPYLKTDNFRFACLKPDGRTDASGCVHFLRPGASGRVRFGASGFLNGAKASHHSIRVVRWWCKGTHRAISAPSAMDFVDFVDFVVQRHTPRGNFSRLLWTWSLVDLVTCGLGHLWRSRWGIFRHRRA